MIDKPKMRERHIFIIIVFADGMPIQIEFHFVLRIFPLPLIVAFISPISNLNGPLSVMPM